MKENPGGFERFGVQWTPVLIVADSSGTERHRFEGFLPVDEFLPQLKFGLAKRDFSANRFADSERRFREIVEQYPKADIAPEALYWAGVSKYKRTDDPEALKETAGSVQSRYPGSVWAKKASIWGPVEVS
jgi:TolA-binding protein